VFASPDGVLVSLSANRAFQLQHHLLGHLSLHEEHREESGGEMRTKLNATNINPNTNLLPEHRLGLTSKSGLLTIVSSLS